MVEATDEDTTEDGIWHYESDTSTPRMMSPEPARPPSPSPILPLDLTDPFKLTRLDTEVVRLYREGTDNFVDSLQKLADTFHDDCNRVALRLRASFRILQQEREDNMKILLPPNTELIQKRTLDRVNFYRRRIERPREPEQE